MDIYDKYWWVKEHPRLDKRNVGIADIEIDIQKVNPKTKSIDDDNSLNTKIEYWIEVMTHQLDDDHQWIACHETDLDCGGDTLDDAINNLYNLTINLFGEYK